MWVDSHCHWNLEPLWAASPQERDLAFRAGVDAWLAPAASPEHWRDLLNLAQQWPQGQLAIALGCHPWFLPSLSKQTELRALLCQWALQPQVVAIGETGLDGFKPHFAQQQAWFEWHLQVAAELKLPVIAHAVKSMDAVIHMVRKYPVAGVVHAFNGSLVQARALIDLGWYLGIGGLLLQPNSRLPKLMRELPTDYLLLETDAPAMKPPQLAGDFNRPVNLLLCAKRLADCLSLTMPELAALNRRNCQRLFGGWPQPL